jgi:nitrogen fixation protein
MYAICRILHQDTGFDPNHEWTNIYNKVTTILAKHDLNGVTNFGIPPTKEIEKPYASFKSNNIAGFAILLQMIFNLVLRRMPKMKNELTVTLLIFLKLNK